MEDSTLGNLLTHEYLRTLVLAIASFMGGLAVKYWSVRVNYTRKIFHFILFGTPFILMPFFPFEHTWWTSVITLTTLLMYLVVVLEPVRRRFWFFDTCFASIDRPEDRPYTLYWLCTQTIATYAVIFPMAWWLRRHGVEHLFLIAILVTGIGDGLAEPIGVRYGRHKYRVRLRFTDAQYFRTLEGSACVLVTAIIVVVCLRGSFPTPLAFNLALVAVPVAMTLAEALAPHTWDAPFLYFTGGATVIAVTEMANRLS